MATMAQIRTACDTKLAIIQAAIDTRQAAYATAHGGRFWQGLATHSALPSEGIEAAPTVGAACPTDQLGQPWPAAILAATSPMAIQVDTYDGPSGKGYTTTLSVRVLGKLYTRTVNSGPEDWRVRPWAETITIVVV